MGLVEKDLYRAEKLLLKFPFYHFRECPFRTLVGMAVYAAIRGTETNCFLRRDERETVVSRIPLRCILSSLGHVTVDAAAPGAFRLVVRVL